MSEAGVRETRFKGLPKQKEFIRDPSREVLYSGAWRAGKSLALALKVATRAAFPGAREGLVRKELVTLKATTLRVLLNGDAQTPPVLPAGCYIHKKAEGIIQIIGGGEIVYFGMDDAIKRGSYSLTGVGVDEAVELDEDDWLMLLGRCSVRASGLSNQLYGACNPGPPSHFLAARFGLCLGYKPMAGCLAIQTRSLDNTFLSPEYIEILGTYTGLRRKRYVEGQWVGSDRLVYDQWDRQVHSVVREGPWKRVVIGVDEGFQHAFAALKLCIDEDGRAHVEREVYRTGWHRPQKIEAIKAISQGAEAVVVDSAVPELIDELKQAGVPARGAEKGPNSVFDQITRYAQPRLLDPGDGRPRLTVDPSCDNTIREFESYEWREGKDEPVKECDDAMDALRYALTYIDGGRPARASFVDHEARPAPVPVGSDHLAVAMLAENKPLDIAAIEAQRLREWLGSLV